MTKMTDRFLYAVPGLGIAFVTSCAFASSVSETRCGWLENPTPANWWLLDKQSGMVTR